MAKRFSISRPQVNRCITATAMSLLDMFEQKLADIKAYYLDHPSELMVFYDVIKFDGWPWGRATGLPVQSGLCAR